MYRERRNNFVYILFWTLLIFLGSLAGLFILSNFIPDSILAKLRGEKVIGNNQVKIDRNKNLVQEPAPTLYQNQDNSTKPIRSETEQGMSSEKDAGTGTGAGAEGKIMNLGAESPIFIDGKITPTGNFTNLRGTIFVAGTLHYIGTYPQDFEQPNTGPSAKISVTLAFGWRNLPNFDEIKRESKDYNTVRISLPPLAILDLQITVTDISFSETSERMRQQTSEYIQTLFDRQLVSKNIVHIAQQRLASAYIAESYSSIELIPY